MLKVFFIVHHLVADSGHVITAVRAVNALRKYKESLPHHWHLGVQVVEMVDEIQEVYRYDNPNYEG